MPAKDILIYANWELTPLTVTMADPDCNSVEGGPEFHYGDVVSISCTSPEFVEWSCDDPTVVFADKTSSTTTFTMGTKSITINHSFKSYTVTFNNGGLFNPIGFGSYLKGDTVTLDMNGTGSLPNYEFVRWISEPAVTFSDPTSSVTTFTMPGSNVKISTQNRFIPPFAVSVVGSTVDNRSQANRGDTVEVKAGNKEGYRFTGWTSVPTVTFADATNPTTTFTMPESAVEVTANWEAIPFDVFVLGHQYGSDDAAAGGGKYVPGETVTIHAGTRADYQFAGWTSTNNDVVFEYSHQPNTTFTMIPENVTVVAGWTPVLYNVNVTGIGGSGGAGQYSKGMTVQINAGDPAVGYRFSKWEVVSGTTPTDLNVNEAITSFTMVSGDLTLNAVWEQIKYSVAVTNSQTTPDGSGSYAPATVVTVNANPTNFHHWEVVSGAITLASTTTASTTFTMPATAVEVKAVYNTEVFHTATIDGVASQHYVGEKVSIDAGTKEGYVFDKWTATPDVQFVDN